MKIIYNILTYITWFFLGIITIFSPKIRLFVQGRRATFQTLLNELHTNEKTIWIHAASLGEYEQGLPIIEGIQAKYPEYQIVLTFFSPSGYEIKKQATPANVVVYLPFDTRANAKKFVELVQPRLVIFIKYEVWPNYLEVLQKKHIPTLLVSAIFNERQAYFKFYGGFLRKSLQRFTHIFTQDEKSKALLHELEIAQVTVSGDTRFDRVFHILKQDNSLDFMREFKTQKTCFVAGSTWPADDTILIEYINNSVDDIKFVIAPHTIKPNLITQLKKQLNKTAVCYTSRNDHNLKSAQVLIVDTIGLLTKIYSYADIAYVGGAFGTGLHNTLEPAVFGKPVIIGPEYYDFKEAKEMVALGGILTIQDQHDFDGIMQELLQDEQYALETGQLNQTYVSSQIGATHKVLLYIHKLMDRKTEGK